MADIITRHDVNTLARRLVEEKETLEVRLREVDLLLSLLAKEFNKGGK